MNSKEKIVGIIKEIRPKQWYKQSLLFLGLLFSPAIFSLNSWFNSFLGALAFSLVCGGVYMFNDINDVEEDRSHPVKKHRPIASGVLGIKESFIYASVFFVSGLVLSFYLNFIFFLIVLLYVIQNIFYSIVLKDIPVVDLIIVAFGMVLRAWGGIVIIDSNITPWLVLIVFLAGLYLVTGKRKREFEEFSSKRKSFDKYSKEQLDNIFVMCQSSLLVVYSFYTFIEKTDYMMLTIVFAFYAITRYNYLVTEELIDDEPRKLLVDRPFIINLIIWLGSIIFIIHYLSF